LHKRLRYADLVKILTIKGWEGGASNPTFRENICDCEQCPNIPLFGESKPGKPNKRGVQRDFPTTAAKMHSLKHYLFSKQKEYSQARSGKTSMKSLTAELLQAKKDFGQVLGYDETMHLPVWVEAISQFDAIE